VKTSERLTLEIAAQPDDTTCGPTCLHGIYRYYGDEVALEQLIASIPSLETGGTLAVHLGIHALRHGYDARLYTFNLEVFDPTWFALGPPHLVERLEASRPFKKRHKTRHALDAYLEFIRSGGEIRMQDLSARLLRKNESLPSHG